MKGRRVNRDKKRERPDSRRAAVHKIPLTRVACRIASSSRLIDRPERQVTSRSTRASRSTCRGAMPAAAVTAAVTAAGAFDTRKRCVSPRHALTRQPSPPSPPPPPPPPSSPREEPCASLAATTAGTMGLGFRWRLVFILVVGLLLWQTSKIWLAFLGDGAATQELQVDQAATPLSEKDDSASQKVHVAVYYEALCPDSRSFVLKQLVPTYRKLSTNMEVELVPYGKAKTVKTNDGYQFMCQHGPIECQANMVHACSIDVIKDPSVQLQFVACMIENNMDPIGIMKACAERIPVDLESMRKCSNTGRGRELLAKYGEMTNSLVPRVSFIPTVTLDGSSEYQVRILKNLLKEVCLHFKVTPKECES